VYLLGTNETYTTQDSFNSLYSELHTRNILLCRNKREEDEKCPEK
jgi:hypothetical protein